MNLPKNYEPSQYEKDIYQLWEQSGAFEAKGKGEPFSMVMPPPNANANLHIGHALMFSIQDVLARYYRLQDRDVAWIPGADHAGFETQVVYEKHLAKEGKSRFDYSRQELYDGIYSFVQDNKQGFYDIFRTLGSSCDWSKFAFTLDDKVVNTAYETFKRLWNDGLVYRGERLVNFCTFHGTAFADIEVEYKDEPGKMYFIKFPLVSEGDDLSEDFVLIATTRPETMLGDVAVAVHPDDESLKHLIGRQVALPLTERHISIVADEMVDTSFGTGAVKITPAHDPNDFEVARRHDLPLVQVITEYGLLGLEAPARYHDLTIDEGRKRIVDELEELGLLEKIEEHSHRVGHCYKCGTIIQPLVRDQWFIDMKTLAKPAIEALRADKVRFYPTAKRDQVITYLENVKDWNISRQIVWGVSIPAFQNTEDIDDWIFDDRVDQETIQVDGKTYRRDPDVFDTWFTSGQWPFVTTGYPKGDDFSKYYPNSVMETGVDILYQWVARMIVLGIYVTGEIPFRDVYLHGMVRAEDGKKMSKSLGNVIDPNEILATHGSDALRMGMLAGRSAGYSAAFAPSKVDAGRNFCNKVWNIARYIEGVIGDDYHARKSSKFVSLADHWIVTRLNHAIESVSNDIEGYMFAEAYETVYHTIWDDFAGWYLEANKVEPNYSVLAYGLEVILKLAHPFMPFTTETIWQTLKWENDSMLAVAHWPKVLKCDADRADSFEDIKCIVSEVRAVAKNLGISKPILQYQASDLIESNLEQIKKLANLESATVVGEISGIRLSKTNQVASVFVTEEVAKGYLGKLEQRQTEEVLSVERLRARLGNKSYVDNAPQALVAETKQQLTDAERRLEQITTEIDSFTA
ncbi:valine--tRNA ligase [Candidatus Saccharibacteria bacterium]|nr:valine--tRNA ligase [Candidatus Saccharibacteria bacterium]